MVNMHQHDKKHGLGPGDACPDCGEKLKWQLTRDGWKTDEDVDTFAARGQYVKTPQPQRNAPCHCGSGRKYKKCCMGNDIEEVSS